MVGAGLVLGPFAGGLLLEHAGGRSPFACAAVLGSLALLALLCFVPVAWRQLRASIWSGTLAKTGPGVLAAHPARYHVAFRAPTLSPAVVGRPPRSGLVCCCLGTGF